MLDVIALLAGIGSLVGSGIANYKNSRKDLPAIKSTGDSIVAGVDEINQRLGRAEERQLRMEKDTGEIRESIKTMEDRWAFTERRVQINTDDINNLKRRSTDKNGGGE